MRKLTFGKYKDKEVTEVIKDDPRYIRWCKENVSGFFLTDEEQAFYDKLYVHKTIIKDYEEYQDYLLFGCGKGAPEYYESMENFMCPMY